MTLRAVLVALLMLMPWPGRVEARVVAGQSLPEALEELKGSGLRLVYSSALVTESMEVVTSPSSDNPRLILDEILAPHGLVARYGPGDRLVVVRREDDTLPGTLCGRVEGLAPGHLPEIRVVVVDTARWVALDKEGRFEIRDLRPGRYEVQARRRDALVSAMPDVLVRSGQSTEIVLQPAEEYRIETQGSGSG